MIATSITSLTLLFGVFGFSLACLTNFLTHYLNCLSSTMNCFKKIEVHINIDIQFIFLLLFSLLIRRLVFIVDLLIVFLIIVAFSLIFLFILGLKFSVKIESSEFLAQVKYIRKDPCILFPKLSLHLTIVDVLVKHFL